MFWRGGLFWRSGAGADDDSAAGEAAGFSVLASATNSPTRSSKSSTGVATVRRERTARLAESEAAGAPVFMMASTIAAFERPAGLAPVTSAIFCRSATLLDSRSERSGVGFAAISVSFLAVRKENPGQRKNKEVPSWKIFRTLAKGRSRTTSKSVAGLRPGVNA